MLTCWWQNDPNGSSNWFKHLLLTPHITWKKTLHWGTAQRTVAPLFLQYRHFDFVCALINWRMSGTKNPAIPSSSAPFCKQLYDNNWGWGNFVSLELNAIKCVARKSKIFQSLTYRTKVVNGAIFRSFPFTVIIYVCVAKLTNLAHFFDIHIHPSVNYTWTWSNGMKKFKKMFGSASWLNENFVLTWIWLNFGHIHLSSLS